MPLTGSQPTKNGSDPRVHDRYGLLCRARRNFRHEVLYSGSQLRALRFAAAALRSTVHFYYRPTKTSVCLLARVRLEVSGSSRSVKGSLSLNARTGEKKKVPSRPFYASLFVGHMLPHKRRARLSSSPPGLRFSHATFLLPSLAPPENTGSTCGALYN